MKNPIKFLALSLLSISLIACNDNKKETDEAYDEYRAYVNDHRENASRYADREWTEIEAEYNEKQRKAEANMAEWSDERKAEYENMKLDWESYREDYLAELSRRDAVAGTKVIMTSILPEGIKEDMSNVDNSNILAVHKQFVNNVEALKDNLTREQWDFVEILWERLDTRKNELEKDMKTDVKLAIAEEKIAYGAIKATNRPVAKTEENSAAKEENKDNK